MVGRRRPAVISYLLLHRLALPPTAVARQPGQVGDLMVRSMGAALAGFGQYVAPLICLSGAAVSAWRRHKRRTLISNTAQAMGADALDGMSWREFEMLVDEAFRLQGFEVSETGGGGADGDEGRYRRVRGDLRQLQRRCQGHLPMAAMSS